MVRNVINRVYQSTKSSEELNMAKCPVCKKEHHVTETICINCGFDQLNREFINQEELQRWMEETIIPCRTVYKAMAEKLSKSLSPVLQEVKSSLNDNWNYDDIIAHPCSFLARNKEYATCEVTNIECFRTKDGSVAIQFLAKKTSDCNGDLGTSWIGFRYKVKDSRGIVIASDLWTASDLVVGDVVERRIYFENISEGCRIEFSDNI